MGDVRAAVVVMTNMDTDTHEEAVEETVPLTMVAAELGIAPEVLQRAVRRGVIRADRVGGAVSISRAEAAVFVENQEMFTDALEPEWREASDVIIARYRLAYIRLR